MKLKKLSNVRFRFGNDGCSRLDFKSIALYCSESYFIHYGKHRRNIKSYCIVLKVKNDFYQIYESNDRNVKNAFTYL